MKISRFVIAALSTTLLSIASASAQYVRPTTGGTMREFNFNNPMSALAATMVMNKAREDALAKSLGRRPSSARNSGNRSTVETPAPPKSKIDESVLRFRPTGSYLKTKELADQMSDDPAQRERCLKIMNGVLDAFGQKTQQLGLANDLATALAFFFDENIRIYRGAPELPDQQYLNLRNMIASALASGGAFARATDRQKQEAYETLVAATGFVQFAYEQALAANRPDLAKTYQQVAGSNLHALTNASPDTLNLTNDGLAVSESDSAPASRSTSVPASGIP